MKIRAILQITHPDIAWHTVHIILHVFGVAFLLGTIAGMPVWTWIPSLFALTVCFYSGYYFELGYRERRLQEFRYERNSK